jgi:acyl-coenzyme A synthetase/AMP-(fatty) acid ligase
VLIIPDMLSSVGLNGAFASLMSGRTIFLFKTVQVPKAVGLYRIEMVVASTYLIHAIADTLKRHPLDFQSVVSVRVSGGAASPELLFDVSRLVASDISFVYGSTEAGIAAELPSPVAARAPGTVGPPAPGVKIRLADEDGSDAAPGTTGEILIQSDNVAMPFVSTAHSVEPGPDHWFHSGDLGTFDPDGNLVLVGRKTDVINVGGVKFLPDIVEDFLVKEPGIEDAAAVSIMPRSGMIEELHLFIVTRTRTHDELVQTLHARLGLARPHKLHLVDAIPRNRLGKIARGELRAIAGRS